MVQALIGFPRHSANVSYRGGSWETDYPVTALSSLPLSRVARSTSLDPEDTVIIGELPARKVVQLLVLCGHNLSTPKAKYRVRLSRATPWSPAAEQVNMTADTTEVTADSTEITADNGNLSTQIYDSGWLDVWPRLPARLVSWNKGNFWLRKYRPEEIANYTWYLPHFIPGSKFAGSFRIDIDDPGNPNGYVQIGMVEVAQALELEANPSYGAQYGYDARSRVTEADGGAQYFERLNKPRRFVGTIEVMSRDFAQVGIFELQRQQDLDQPFFWWPDRDDEIHTIRNAFLARQAELGLLAYAFPNYDAAPVNFREVLG